MAVPREQAQDADHAKRATHTLKSHSNRLTVSLTHAAIDVSGTLTSVRDPSAGAIVMFAGTTRDFSGRPVKRQKTEGEGAIATGAPDASREIREEDEGGKNEEQQEYASVSKLTYTSYIPLALKTMQGIGEILFQHGPLDNDAGAPTQRNTSICKISMVHRLGEVPIMDESVVICVSAQHRQEAWRCGEWLLEQVKRRVEVWKWEEFVDGLALREGGGDDTEIYTRSKTNDADDGGTWRSNVNDDRHTEQRKRGARIAGAPRV